jgi:hypothetical protein
MTPVFAHVSNIGVSIPSTAGEWVYAEWWVHLTKVNKTLSLGHYLRAHGPNSKVRSECWRFYDAKTWSTCYRLYCMPLKRVCDSIDAQLPPCLYCIVSACLWRLKEFNDTWPTKIVFLVIQGAKLGMLPYKVSSWKLNFSHTTTLSGGNPNLVHWGQGRS